MTEKPSHDELKRRIIKHVESCQNNTELVSSCWHGYLAALLEWGMISPEEHRSLIQLLPQINNNPVEQIFLGVEPNK